MKLSEYIKSKHLGLNVKALAEFAGINASTLHRKYKADPALIDQVVDRYKNSMSEA